MYPNCRRFSPTCHNTTSLSCRYSSHVSSPSLATAKLIIIGVHPPTSCHGLIPLRTTRNVCCSMPQTTSLLYIVLSRRVVVGGGEVVGCGGGCWGWKGVGMKGECSRLGVLVSLSPLFLSTASYFRSCVVFSSPGFRFGSSGSHGNTKRIPRLHTRCASWQD